MKTTKREPTVKWVKRNSKLNKNPLRTVGFGIPAGKTCPGAGSCFKPCYAQKGAYTWKSTVNARQHNLMATIKPDFDYHAVVDLWDMPDVEAVRIHDSGDFYSQRYLDLWKDIAAACPEKLFYAYTKSLHLNWSNMPSNFIIIQSEGGKYDHLIDYSKPHAVIFETLEELEAAGYTNGSETDEAAYSGQVVKIGLIKH